MDGGSEAFCAFFVNEVSAPRNRTGGDGNANARCFVVLDSFFLVSYDGYEFRLVSSLLN